jgi:hypothetical protein
MDTPYPISPGPDHHHGRTGAGLQAVVPRLKEIRQRSRPSRARLELSASADCGFAINPTFEP